MYLEKYVQENTGPNASLIKLRQIYVQQIEISTLQSPVYGQMYVAEYIQLE